MAKFNFLNLDEETRKLMLLEINSDIENGRLYLSDRLNALGQEKYPIYLTEVVTNSNEEALERLLDINTHFNSTYLRQGKHVKMPSNASALLSQSEFNRFYIRGLCLRAVSNNTDNVEVYRARESGFARPGSEARIGALILARDLLDDLRTSIGIEPKLFPEINSGLCIKV
jgi:hypothetical protein